MHFGKLFKVLTFSLVFTTAAAGFPAYAAQEKAGSLTLFISDDSSDTGTTEDTAEDTDDSAKEDASSEDASADDVTDDTDASANEQDTASDDADSASETDGTEDDTASSEETDSASGEDTSDSSLSESDTDSSDSGNKKNKNTKTKNKKNKKNKKKTQAEKDAEKAEKKKQRLNAKWRASVKPYTVSATKTVHHSYDTYHLIGDSSVACFTSYWKGYNAITSHYTYTKTKNMTDTTDTADIIASVSDPLALSPGSGTADARSGLFEVLYKFGYATMTAQTADDSNAYFVVSLLPTGDKQTDKKIRRYNRVLRAAASQNAHVHYIDVYEYAKKRGIYADEDLTEAESRKLYKRIKKMTARFNTEQDEEETTVAKQWNIPSGLGRSFVYMGWSKVTNRSSAQYSLRASYGEEYDADGFAKIQADTDRYVIACTTYFGKVGDLIDFTLSNGEVIHTIVGDIKNQEDEGCTILGHAYGQSIVEFIVNTSLWYGTSKTVTGFHPEWEGCSVSKVTNYGNISEQ